MDGLKKKDKKSAKGKPKSKATQWWSHGRSIQGGRFLGGKRNGRMQVWVQWGQCTVNRNNDTGVSSQLESQELAIDKVWDDKQFSWATVCVCSVWHKQVAIVGMYWLLHRYFFCYPRMPLKFNIMISYGMLSRTTVYMCRSELWQIVWNYNQELQYFQYQAAFTCIFHWKGCQSNGNFRCSNNVLHLLNLIISYDNQWLTRGERLPDTPCERFYLRMKWITWTFLVHCSGW